ncbi:disease resistance protein RPP13-like [Oryza brachyantha]|uniref:NB-ARC domain-containing protein n=1 Tax=Oryza brachyantha TaxID=4533 RepID=J3MRD7_ORYBR|nr:disease resistance protein RPP13-like [Oryza brachyantha]
MAEIAVGLVARLIQTISTQVEKEVALQQSESENTRFVMDELETIGAFLGVVENMKEDSPKYQMARVWAEQVKDLAYDMEDCLETRFTALTTQSSSWSQYITNYRVLRPFAVKLNDLKSRIVEVSERNRRYNLVTADQPINNHLNLMVVLGGVWSRSLKVSTEIDTYDDWKKEVVPWDEPSKVPTSNEETRNLKVAAMVGMCGSGKTTRAREIYEDKRTIKNFEYRVWIKVSQAESITKVFMDMIAQLSDASARKGKHIGDEDELARQIQGKLEGKQFLLVFDDLWTTRAWYSIKRALPQVGKSGSRIIVTTEIFHVAEDCTGSFNRVHRLPLLSDQKSFQLLKDSILQSENSKMSPEDKKDFEELDLDSLKLPEPLFNTIAQILRKCSGLELAIETVAKLLASNSPRKWGKLCDDLPSLLYNDPSLNEIRKVMIRSYRNLPPYLRPCFLYLSIFPEDSHINVETVVERWLAEGLVRERTGMSLRAVAQGYFSELLDRSMIVAVQTKNRSCKTCRIHPMMRDILVMIAQEEKVSVTIGARQSSSLLVKRMRHLTLDGQSDRKLARCVEFSGIRSLTVFSEPSESIAEIICSSQLRALRVLDLSNASFQITQRDIRRVGELCHLRYLNLYKSNICELPSSIGMLPFLELLNVRKTCITKLTSEVVRLGRLYSLRASRRAEDCCHNKWKQCCCDSAVTVPKGIENLQDIEWLDIVDIKDSCGSKIKALGKLPRLKHLGLTGITVRNSKEISKTLKNISSSLIYLYLGACRNDGTLACLPISEKKKKRPLQFPCLQSIKLDGHIGKMPYWISNSLTLEVVKLCRTNLQQSDIMSLEKLPCLVMLALLDNSYVSDTLVFYAKSFRALNTLEISKLPKLKTVIFTEGAVSHLRRLDIRCCTLRLKGRKHLKLRYDPQDGVEVV